MKPLFIGLLLVMGVSTGSDVPDQIPPIAPKLTILKVSMAATLDLRLANTSSHAIRLFEEANSWGAMNWRVLRIRNGQVDTFYQSPYQLFTKNNPKSYELASGAHRDSALDINGGNWCGLGHCSSWDEKGLGGKRVTFAKGDQIIVIYEAPVSKESQQLKVFSGVTSASTIVQ